MILIKLLIVIVSLIFMTSCNSGKSEEEMEELWSKAQTTGQIIERSGTAINPTIDKDLAMRDAQTRLQTGGGLFGKKGLSVSGLINQDTETNTVVGSIGMTINVYLWKASLDTINFMPLSSADPIGGTIITDWYTSTNNPDERCKLNIFISGTELKTQNLRVASFCQNYINDRWVNKEINNDNNIQLENAILNKAKKIKLQSS